MSRLEDRNLMTGFMNVKVMKNVRLLVFLVIVLIAACKQEGKQVHEDSQKKTQTKDSVVTKETRIGIKMTKIGGVYQIPCYVNGVKMNFIFDTGASNVCISLTEAMFLAKNGYLEDSDYIGRSKAQIADGSVVENMEINLHSIEIEGIMVTEVKATVVKSIDAPLLLGQSALKKLGRIEIDGDSLFIIKKGKARVTERKKETVVQEENTSVPGKPIEHWYDWLLAKLGYRDKIDEYLGCAWQAYEADLPDLAITYCDKAQNLKKTAKGYGLKGYIQYKQFSSLKNGSNDYNNLVDSAKVNLEDYVKRNGRQETLYYASGDSLTYRSQTLYLAWAYTCGDSINYARSLELAQELYMQDGQDVDAMNLISYVYTLQGKYDLAEKWAKKILDTHKDDWFAYFRLAYLAYTQNRTSEAIRYYEKCSEIDSESVDCLSNLAVIYWNLKTGEKWGSAVYGMRDYAVSLWQKAARLGSPYAQRSLRKKGYEW